MISTSDEFRGKGFGQRITSKALHDATGKGISIGVLQATRQGLNLYKKIGFQENGKFIIYWKVGKTYM
jgi:ribosomal protein S18 acetylase RimI-like enzyme